MEVLAGEATLESYTQCSLLVYNTDLMYATSHLVGEPDNPGFCGHIIQNVTLANASLLPKRDAALADSNPPELAYLFIVYPLHQLTGSFIQPSATLNVLAEMLRKIEVPDSTWKTVNKLGLFWKIKLPSVMDDVKIAVPYASNGRPSRRPYIGVVTTSNFRSPVNVVVTVSYVVAVD